MAVALGGVIWSVELAAEQGRCVQTPSCFGFEGPPPGMWLSIPFGLIGVVLTGVGLPLFLVGSARERRLRSLRPTANGFRARF